MSQEFDSTALEVDTIYRTYSPFIWKVARARGIPLASIPDLLQEVFLTVLRRLPTYQERGTLKGWLYIIADGHIRMYFRSEGRRLHRMMKFAQIEPEGSTCETEDLLVRSEAAQRVQEFVDALPEQLREVFLLCCVEGMPRVEVARLLQLNINTLYGRERDARRRFCAFAEGPNVAKGRSP